MTMPFPTEVVVCRACGAQNRIRKDLRDVQFRCGSCHRPIVRPTRFDRALDAAPGVLFRGGRQLLEILIFAIPLWIGWDSTHPKQEPAKSTESHPTVAPTPAPQPQPVRSFEEIREAAIAALPSPQLASTPAATLSPEASERWKSPEWQAFWASAEAQAIINRLEEPAHERAKELRALYLATHQAHPSPAPFDQPEVLLPGNGEVAIYPAYRNRALAPFGINPSSDSNYLVKLTDAYTGTPVQTIFVRSGSPVKVKVPLGTFTIKYAAGVKWYGYHYLFGPATSYSKAIEPFTFTSDATGFTGYTITLYKVRDGNLQTQPINPDEF